MFADVYPIWNASCSDCAEGSGPHDDLDDAEAWAKQHNDEHHQEAS